MLPNVRLMIVATFASVVVLICGFGVFAAFRVSHDPFARLPSAAAPLQPAVVNAQTSAVNVAVAEPFDQRFQIGEPRGGNGISALAYSAPQPAEQPAIKAVAPAADDPEQAAAQPELAPDSADRSAQPATVVEAAPAKTGVAVATDEARVTADPQPEPAPAAEEKAAMASTLPDPAAVAPEQDVKSSMASQPTDEPAPAAAPDVADVADVTDVTDVAAIEPLADPPLPLGRPNFESDSGRASAAATTDKAEKKTKHARAARLHARRVRANSFAQDSSFQEPNLQTGPAPTRAARSPRPKVTSATTGEPGSAVGGPYVTAPNR
jgi:hypothetical protein